MPTTSRDSYPQLPGPAVAGPRWLVRELAAWGRLSPFATVEPATPVG